VGEARDIRGLLAGAQPSEDARQGEWDQIAHEIDEDEKTCRVGAWTRKSQGSITPSIESVSEIGAEHTFKAKSASLSAQGIFLLMIVLVFWWATVKKVNNMHLQNIVIQLRKVRSHPLLFDWPLDL